MFRLRVSAHETKYPPCEYNPKLNPCLSYFCLVSEVLPRPQGARATSSRSPIFYCAELGTSVDHPANMRGPCREPNLATTIGRRILGRPSVLTKLGNRLRLWRQNLGECEPRLMGTGSIASHRRSTGKYYPATRGRCHYT